MTQAVDVDLLGVVRGVLGFAGTGTVTLDGLGQDDGRLTLMVDRLVVGRIDLVRVVAATVELPDLVVGQVFDHCLEFWGVEEVLTDVRTVLGLVVLVLAVDDFVHAALQGTVGVLGEQRIPEAAPDDFVDVPATATEHAFEFWMILPLPRTGPSRRCRLQLMTKIRLSSFSRPARAIAPRDSGSSHSPSPMKHQTFCLPAGMKPRASGTS